MIEGNRFVEIVKNYFEFLIKEFGFVLDEEKIRGNAFYDVQFKNMARVISMSYENIEDYFQVVIFRLQNGQMPDYDDKVKTLLLNKLNSAILSRIDRRGIDLNNEYFAKFTVKNGFERKLLKSAKELRLCLKHFDELQ